MPDRRLDTIVFDLDGVLADSRDPITRCLNLALGDHGLATEPEDRLRRLIGPPLHDAFVELLAERGQQGPDVAELVAAYRRHYAEISLETPLYPGIADALDRLAGVARLAVATSKPETFARPILEARGIADRFVAIVGPPLANSHHETKSGTVARALSAAAAAPESTAMVGDRRFDMQAATDHALLPVAALWGFGSRQELTQAGARLYLEAPTEIATLGA